MNSQRQGRCGRGRRQRDGPGRFATKSESAQLPTLSQPQEQATASSSDNIGNNSTNGKRHFIRGMFQRGTKKFQTFQADGQNGQEKSHNRKYMQKNHFRSLDLIKLTQESSDNVVITLATQNEEFHTHLNSPMTPDILVLTLQVLAHLQNAIFTETMTSVLSTVCSSNFLNNLQNFCVSLPFENKSDQVRNSLYHDHTIDFWTNVYNIFEKMLAVVPSKARNQLPNILEKIIKLFPLLQISSDMQLDEKTKIAFKNMFDDVEEETRKKEIKNEQICLKGTEINELEPPTSFRTLGVVPTLVDMYETQAFLRPCKIKEAYNSVEHYLDVQFRLLREDFLTPLRNGLRNYLDGPGNKKNYDIRIYRKVKLLPIAANLLNNHQMNIGSVKVSFGIIKGMEDKWKYSKRFMKGGLLLLSGDNFQTILFMTVANRDEKDLKIGEVLAEPLDGTVVSSDDFQKTFVMLESKIYFEPYKAVLNALMHFDESNFPMKKYFVEAQSSNDLPAYLRDQPSLKYKNFSLPIGHNVAWPSPEQMNLDESQYDAFRRALTEELALIQGPPGTGKTFIALEIVRTLLLNKSCWNTFGPIIVVCLTNHALDQFLEAILAYTDKIARVGSRSKSEALEKYTLFEWRKRSTRFRNSSVRILARSEKSNLEYMLNDIKLIKSIITNLCKPGVIVSLDNLRCKNTITKLETFKTDIDLFRWLLRDDMNECEFEIGDDYYLIHPMDVINNRCLEITKDVNDLGVENRNKKLQQLKQMQNRVKCELHHHIIVNPPRYPPRCERWRLYWECVTLAFECNKNQLQELQKNYHQAQLKYKEVNQLMDLEILETMDIVGLTTTAAAKMFESMHALRAPIVILEEAAEILESHVLCSLGIHCQHVVLIGDHKQLRPKTSVYKLGKTYNLNTSLFERMLNIKDCTQLMYQHRMRPDFAKLITPSIYKELHNHESVLKHQNVKGVRKDLFFLDHNNREKNWNEGESWINQYEVELSLSFVEYLLRQGYNPTEITVLCTYTGQLFAFQRAKQCGGRSFKEVRITTVDNYQGEENKIIILSLVRNNGEGEVGFLKEENRVCVALSRAREGLFIMGNMDDLVVKNSIWPQIKEVLENSESIGDVLELQCQIHQDQITQIKDAKDFRNCPEGGCSKICNLVLSCGHNCLSFCHPTDREHKEYKCQDRCVKRCPYDHQCPLKCFKPCLPCTVKVERELKCGHTVSMECRIDPETFPCDIQVDGTLPDCQHVIKKPCHKRIEECACTYPCESRLPCGHACTLNCHVTRDPEHIEFKCGKECERIFDNCSTGEHKCRKRCHEECGPCSIPVEKSRSCGHFFKRLECSKNVEDIDCERPCKRIMSCGHKCKLKCKDNCGSCQALVKKVSSCSHTIKVKCCEEATPSKCSGKCPKTLPCGHFCTSKCREICDIVCKVMVDKTELGLCGHKLSLPCYLRANKPNRDFLKYCREPCGAQLSCGHKCKGTCGSCYQGRVHIICQEPCSKILVCGHACAVGCKYLCQPCTMECTFECRHSKCKKRCGQPCMLCKEKCEWGCKHRRCSKLCSDLCDIEPCLEHCEELLNCGHPCVGFCGDPCPPLCRICNEEELTEIFFGHEDEPDARFVFLEDCKHCIEHKGLTSWLGQSNGEMDKSIQVKACPKCKAPITKCMRIMNLIRTHMHDVISVRDKVFFGNKDLKSIATETTKTLTTLIEDVSGIGIPIELKDFLKNLLDRISIQGKGKRPTFSAQEAGASKIVLDIVRKILTCLVPVLHYNRHSFFEHIKAQLNFLLNQLPLTMVISEQKVTDITFELGRLRCMAQICQNGSILQLTEKIEFRKIINKLTGFQRFTEDLEKEVVNDINGLNILSQKLLVAERMMVAKVMNFSPGHWFKCPNGHIYAIDQCGGAVHESKCIECKATVGGSQHRLRGDNAVATEMDGATQSAYDMNVALFNH